MPFKVLYKSRAGNLYSALLGTKCGVKYVPGVWRRRLKLKGKMHPDYGPFAVFGTIWQARSFARDRIGCSIWRCEIKESRAKHIWNRKWSKCRWEVGSLPFGTILADEVMITEEV